MKRNTIEAALFLPAMVVLAALLFAGFYLVIRFGSLVLFAWHWLFAHFLHLPASAANAFAVMGTALTVYAAFYGLGKVPFSKLRRRG